MKVGFAIFDNAIVMAIVMAIAIAIVMTMVIVIFMVLNFFDLFGNFLIDPLLNLIYFLLQVLKLINLVLRTTLSLTPCLLNICISWYLPHLLKLVPV